MNLIKSYIGTFFTKKQSTTNIIYNSIYDIALNDINGSPINLSNFKGKKILFVNVASKCGFTKQYKELQELFEKYRESLTIIGLPCNQFGKQEPGTSQEIQEFCSVNYGVSFLISEKLDVKGTNQHPIYQWLTQKKQNKKFNSKIKWNFYKYLVNEDGIILDYFSSITNPLNKKITNYLK